MANDKKRIYAWEFPVRFTHWINVACILALSFTGFYIGNPFIYAVSAKEYIMGWIRFIHFVAAYAFLLSMIIRIYWAFVGNKYACYRELLPFSSQKLAELVNALKFYAFISKKPPYKIGHHALAAFTYLIVYLLIIFEIVSGFAMYSVNHSGAIWVILGGWLTGAMSMPMIRLYHHLVMYVILAFALMHVYLAWYSDSREKNGLLMSIFSGYKFSTGNEPDI
ncbi:MAG: Ni/Fe-hydrogenase, b-type cytochrome subunit [Nitrospirae bacterium]|nr:Ni/Fe-hydrogenase, b-type cytochrome subunit [Nitrospirota bacterium]